MIEESPEGFIQRWRAYAAEVQVFPRTEGSPMLECLAGGAIVQLLDRTGPYQGGSGRRRVILNPMVEALDPEPSQACRLEVSGLGALEGAGRVVARDGRVVVVDCGVPLVVALLGDGAATGTTSSSAGVPAPGGYEAVTAGPFDTRVPDASLPNGGAPTSMVPDVGDYVRFTSVPPAHGFVISEERRDRRADAGESTDDAM